MIKLGIFIFRRDCRLYDNIALNLLSKEVDIILPIFILDSNQIIKTKLNENYFSSNVVQYICETLKDLNEQLQEYNSKLFLFYGQPWEILTHVLTRLNKTYEITVAFNNDFSPYSEKRDNAIRKVCFYLNIAIINSNNDYTLNIIDKLIKSDGTAFKQYGAFYSNATKLIPLKPESLSSKTKFVNIKFESEIFKSIKSYYKLKNLNNFYKTNNLLAQRGGRKEALKRLHLAKNFSEYNEKRDLLSYNTTNLSAGLNMGCISSRETYWYIKSKLGDKNQILKQLYWRDFFLIAYIYIPNAKSFKQMIDPRYDEIKWPSNTVTKPFWNAMMSSKTGFLLIDAGMQELQKTGFLHNRLRMILGVFWTKYLHISILNPKYGSHSGFARMLIDAIGPSQNKMNHHWILDFDYPGKKFSAKGAPLSGRPMKIDNLMIKKWDPECIYIKKWLPHLSNYKPKELYKWSGSDIHPGPIFDPKVHYTEWIEMCKGIK